MNARHQKVGAKMRRFWDAKARENAMFFIHNQLDYADVDEGAFWSSGVENLDRTLDLFALQIRPGDRVVEIGCGIGRMTRAIAARAASVVGIDVSVEMVDRARRELADLDNVEVFVGSGHDLGAVPDASADVVYSFIVFQHIPDPEITCGYIREIGRVLRPGGWTVFHVSQLPELHRPETWRKARRWRRVLQWHPNRARHVELAPEWLGSALTSAQLSAAIREAGLVLEAVVGEGTQFCLVHARRREVVGNPRAGSAVGA